MRGRARQRVGSAEPGGATSAGRAPSASRGQLGGGLAALPAALGVRSGRLPPQTKAEPRGCSERSRGRRSHRAGAGDPPRPGSRRPGHGAAGPQRPPSALRPEQEPPARGEWPWVPPQPRFGRAFAEIGARRKAGPGRTWSGGLGPQAAGAPGVADRVGTGGAGRTAALCGRRRPGSAAPFPPRLPRAAARRRPGNGESSGMCLWGPRGWVAGGGTAGRSGAGGWSAAARGARSAGFILPRHPGGGEQVGVGRGSGGGDARHFRSCFPAAGPTRGPVPGGALGAELGRRAGALRAWV